MNTRPNIYEYLDYRAFLKSMYEFKKQTSVGFSYRSFSRMAGLKSSNFLQLVMEAKRNLSQSGIHQFSKAFKLSKSETNFFEVLVLFNQSKNIDEKNRYYERISQSKAYNNIKPLEVSQYAYFSNWYFVALRELVTLKNFREDPRWINQKLKTKIPAEEIKRAIQILLELKLLTRDTNNCLRQSVEQISTTPEMGSLAIINFHREMLKKASDSIESTRASHRDISALTMAVSKEQFEEIRERLSQFQKEVHAISSQSKERSAVYQLNLQLFNLSEVTWG